VAVIITIIIIHLFHYNNVIVLYYIMLYNLNISKTNHRQDAIIINPRRACTERITVVVLCVCVCVCVCLSVTTLTATYLIYESKVQCYNLGSLRRSKHMYCVDFAENALFANFGVIC
jgi:uncharacterized membrane protein